MTRNRSPRRGRAAMRRTTRIGGARRAFGPFQPLPLRWKSLSALVLLALLVGSGTAVHATPDTIVEAVQRTLSERGYDPGKVDGVMGWRTRGALRKFQRTVGLLDTGLIDDETLAALGLESPGGAPAEADVDASQGKAHRAEPAPGTGAPKAETPSAKPTTKPDPDTFRTETHRAEPAPGTGVPKAETPSAKPATTLGAGTPETEPPRAEPAPERTARPEMSFALLGWHPPQSGAEALARFDALGAPRDFKRGTGSLFVPKAELVFVLQAGERVPGLGCDPGAERLSTEFVFGPDGPVIFTPVSGGEYCRMGIGIAIEVGGTLEMRHVDWRDTQYPRGTVRITGRGLEYVR